jgi:hypothetical protein
MLVVAGLAWWFSTSASCRVQHGLEAAERVKDVVTAAT